MGHLVERGPALCDASGFGGSDFINHSMKLLRKGGVLSMSARNGEPVANFDADRVMMIQVIVRGTRGHRYQAVELALTAMTSGKFRLSACRPMWSASPTSTLPCRWSAARPQSAPFA